MTNSRQRKHHKKDKREDKKSHRYLNSWEQGGIVQDDEDIKEEFVSDNSDYQRKTPNEETSAATFLLESMSKVQGRNDSSDGEEIIEDDEDLDGAYSSSQFEMFKKVKNDKNRMRSASRPYSPPFSQFIRK